METDADLVLAARRGSQEALGLLFDRHWARVWRAAYSATGDRELANDAAQDAILRAAAALRRFDHRRPLEPWLVRIAVNRAIDLVRRQRRLVPEEGLVERFAFDAEPADEELAEALRSLGPERRAVIALTSGSTTPLPRSQRCSASRSEPSTPGWPAPSATCGSAWRCEMSDEIERRLREAGHRLPAPAAEDTLAARARLLEAQPAQRGRPRRGLALAFALLLVIGGAFGVGYAVAAGGGTTKTVTKTRAVKEPLNAGPGFLPDSEWYTAVSGSAPDLTVTAANVPLDSSGTVRTLGPNTVVLRARFWPASSQQSLPTAFCRSRSRTRLRRAARTASCASGSPPTRSTSRSRSGPTIPRPAPSSRRARSSAGSSSPPARPRSP